MKHAESIAEKVCVRLNACRLDWNDEDAFGVEKVKDKFVVDDDDVNDVNDDDENRTKGSGDSSDDDDDDDNDDDDKNEKRSP